MNLPLKFSFYPALAASLFLFSCTRAVEDKVTITISFPSAQSVQKFSNSITALNLAPTEAVTNFVPQIAEFAPEIPEAPEEYKGYCYFVTVSYPQSDAPNRNFCGRKDLTAIRAPTTAGDDIAVTPTFNFSQNFKGLIKDDAVSTSNIELADILIGTDRTVTIIGVPVTDIAYCEDVLSQPMNKSVMLKPRIIGSVTQDIQVGTNEIKIAIDKENPKEVFDDCVITDTKLNFPEAEKTVIEQERFLFNYMRAFNSEIKGYVCQPLTVGLRANVGTFGRDVPAALNFDSSILIRKSVNGGTPAVVNTYNSHENCIGDATGTAGKSAFVFPRNQPQKRRWIQVTETEGRTLDFTAYTIDRDPQVSVYDTSRFKLISDDKYMLDHAVPHVMQLDVCYKVATSLRTISGGNTSSPAGQTLNLYNAGTAKIYFYLSSTQCAAGTPVSSIALGPSPHGVEYWVKVPSTLASAGDRIELRPVYGVSPTGLPGAPFTPSVVVYAAADTQTNILASQNDALNIDNVGIVTGLPKLDIPNINGACYPLNIHVNNRLGAAISANPGMVDFKFLLKDLSTLENYENVAIRYQPVDLTKDGNTGGYTLNYGGALDEGLPCSYSNFEPISASSTVVTGSTAVSNGTFYTLFIATNGDSNYGRRRIQLYYGGTSTSATVGYPVGQIDFELTRPD